MLKTINKILEDFIGRDKKGRPWMNIRDKVRTTTILNEKKRRFCPKHYLPHTLPFIGKPIKDEECHIHTTAWRDSHHSLFCKLIRCKNCKAMLKARKNFKIRNWIFTDKQRNRKRVEELKLYP